MTGSRSTLLAVFVAVLCPLATAQPITSTFTYQGELSEGGVPVSGTYDLTFRLFDAASGGTQFGPALCVDDLAVTNGKFAVSLDFGSVFPGLQRFIQVQVRSGGSTDCSDATGYTTLIPRQELTAAPHATFASTASLATSALSAIDASTLNNQPASFYLNAANLSGTLADARLSINVARRNAANTFLGPITAPTFTGALTGNASSATLASNATNLGGNPGSFYQDASNLIAGTLADSRLSANVALLGANNSFTGTNSFVQSTTFQSAIITGSGGIGSITPDPVRLVVNNNTALTLSSGPLSSGDSGLRFPNIVAGNNSVDPSNQGAAVLSGGTSTAPNQVLAGSSNSVIAGGRNNILSGVQASIGGGIGNTVSGPQATIGGGVSNTASAGATTVAGGHDNEASAVVATVSGGGDNLASGDYSTVPGGFGNKAGGRYSFAAGQGAVVRDTAATGTAFGDIASFVWSDASSGDDFTSTGSHQFLIRSVGGVGINTNAPEAALHVSSGSAGAVRASFTSTAVLERDDNNALSILGPDTAVRSVYFGSPAGSTHGGVSYSNLDGMFLQTSFFTRLRIDASGNVGIGQHSPKAQLHVVKGTSTVSASASTVTAILESNGVGNHLAIMTQSAPRERGIAFGTPADQFHGGMYYTDTDGMSLRTGGNATRMMLDEVGNVRIGLGTEAPDAQLHVESAAARVIKVDRGGSDGELLSWARDDVSVGSVTVAAGVVTYGAFTGVHYATLEAPVETFSLVTMTGRNTILGNRDATKTQGETVYGVHAASKPNDPAALGVYMGTIDAADFNHATPIALIAAVGNADMLVVDNGTGDAIAPGDYLISSDVPGAAMKLDPAKYPIGHVIAKAASAIDWSQVTADTDGIKRAKASVLFTSFTHTDPSLGERLSRLEELLGHK